MNPKKHSPHITAAATYQEGFERSQTELSLQQQKKSVFYKGSVKAKTAGRILLLLFLFSATHVYSQKRTQSIRGTVIDQESKVPIAGATVLIVGSDTLPVSTYCYNIKTKFI